MAYTAMKQSSSAVHDLSKKLNGIGKEYSDALTKVSPEFGAYMKYSAYLEFGYTHASKKLSVLARPHIVPAIVNNALFIRSQLVKEIKNGIQTGEPPEKVVQRAWVRVLNDKPRRDAVAAAPYKYGFHRRSIRGSAHILSEAEVAAEYQKAAAARAAKAKSERDRAKAKKAKS